MVWRGEGGGEREAVAVLLCDYGFMITRSVGRSIGLFMEHAACLRGFTFLEAIGRTEMNRELLGCFRCWGARPMALDLLCRFLGYFFIMKLEPWAYLERGRCQIAFLGASRAFVSGHIDLFETRIHSSLMVLLQYDGLGWIAVRS